MEMSLSAFKAVTQRIDETDYSGYTIQYPPMFVWDTIQSEDLKSGWRKSLDKNKDHLGLYVHIPFCATRCTFCRYYAVALSQERDIDGYLSALKNEIQLYGKIFGNTSFSTLYIGGGTPSLLNMRQLNFLFESIYKCLDFTHKKQVVFEGISDFLSYDKLVYLKEMGLNRLTLGIQTTDKGVLKGVNRCQNSAEFFRCYHDARKASIHCINVDIMLGLPGQTLNNLWETFREVIKVKPDMIHCHPFYPAKFTTLQHRDHKQIDKMVRFAQEVLKKYGYQETAYDAEALTPDAVNFQLADAIEHNSSYLGVGAAAVSHATGYLRSGNTDDIKYYMSQLQKNRLAVTKGIRLSQKDEMIYYVTANLRYGKVSRKGFKSLFGKELNEVFAKEIIILEKMLRIREEKGDLISLMANYDEYAVYSKIFFDQKIFDSFLSETWGQ